MDEFERYNTCVDETNELDDLERYITEPRAPPTVTALQWWQDNHQFYPILHHMAFDHLAALASSSADERQFSMAGNSLNEERYHTIDDLAEATQSLKSWHSQGLLVDGDGKEVRTLSPLISRSTSPAAL